MARPTRIDFPGALFHVIARGNQGDRTFRDPSDFGKYQVLLQRYQERYRFGLYAYVLMPNHLHLLVETGAVPLAKIMQGLQQSYTAYFNKKYRLRGHCFQGRYKAILCDQDAYLLTLVRYLHLNPVRSRLVRLPGRWRWSSHGAYLGSVAAGWVAADRVLGQFGRDRAKARGAYQRFLAEGVPEGHRKDLYEIIEQRYLGGEAFIEVTERNARHRPDRPRIRPSLDECIRAVCDVLAVPPESLGSQDRSGNLPTARALLAYVCREDAGIPYAKVAKVVNRAQVTLSLQVQRLRCRLEAEPGLARILDRVVMGLRGGRNKGIKA
jgi:REP-associated tyrosine transposase